MDFFIKLHSVRTEKLIAVNTHWIMMLEPSVVGCQIQFVGEERPLLVRESFEEVERIIAGWYGRRENR